MRGKYTKIAVSCTECLTSTVLSAWLFSSGCRPVATRETADNSVQEELLDAWTEIKGPGPYTDSSDIWGLTGHQRLYYRGDTLLAIEWIRPDSAESRQGASPRVRGARADSTTSEFWGLTGHALLDYLGDTLVRMEWTTLDTATVTSSTFSYLVSKLQQQYGTVLQVDTTTMMEHPFLLLETEGSTPLISFRMRYEPFKIKFKWFLNSALKYLK